MFFFRLGVFFFVVFDAAAVYGLITTSSHFDDIVATCNKNNNNNNNDDVRHLWTYVLARLVLSFAEIGALCFFYYTSLEKDDDESFQLKRASLVTILHVLYICVSTDLLKRICDDALCVTALSDASGYVGSLSFTGFVYLCIDAVLVLLYSCPMFIETLSFLDK